MKDRVTSHVHIRTKRRRDIYWIMLWLDLFWVFSCFQPKDDDNFLNLNNIPAHYLLSPLFFFFSSIPTTYDPPCNLWPKPCHFFNLVTISWCCWSWESQISVRCARLVVFETCWATRTSWRWDCMCLWIEWDSSWGNGWICQLCERNNLKSWEWECRDCCLW